jgi:hypothetical protein
MTIDANLQAKARQVFSSASLGTEVGAILRIDSPNDHKR